MVWVKRGALALVTVLVLVFVALASWEPIFATRGEAPDIQTYRAEIIRDDYGVPAIHGKRDVDVAYGVAIAQAEDDFFTLQDVVAMSRGRYGAIAGEDGAPFDFAYHLIDARGTAEREYPGLPADTKALFEAYAAGLNHYAQAHPEQVKLSNLFPVNGTDVAAGFALRQPFFFGLGNVIGPLVEGGELRREFGPDIPGFERKPVAGDGLNAKPPAAARQLSHSALHPLPIGDDAGLLGSNAFAVAPEKTGGPTVLISNSHQPLTGGVAWYEMTVESEQGWHFTGANFPGSPFPFLGHNEHLGWTNTVNRPDLVDIYQLEMDEDGTSYRLGEQWLELDSETVWLPVRKGPLVLPIPRRIHRSVHGPVIENDNGFFAIRYGGMGKLDQLDAYYRLNKATSFDEWREQIARLAIPSTNFIYADETGNIAFIYNAAIPDRPEDVQANWRGVLPGNRPELIWQGLVDFSEIPSVVNPPSGWIYNANNEPFTAAGAGSDLSPDDFSPVLGIERKQTNRSRRAYKLLSEASLLDRETLEAIKYDTTYEREGYVAQLFDALESEDFLAGEAGDDSLLAQARELLLGWDFTADNKGRADALALLMIKDFMSAEYLNKTAAEAPDARASLAAAADHLMTHFGRLDPPMSALLRLRMGDVDLPLDGGSDTLRASTSWEVDPDGRLRLVHGDSYILWVEWPGTGAANQRVFSRSIQPFGSAISRPDSPHHTDQMQLFVDHRLKPVRFWSDEVLANAQSRQVVTNAR